MDEYNKALQENKQKSNSNSSGGSSSGGSGGGNNGGSTPKYVGVGHEPFYKNAASRNVFNKNYKNTFDAPVSKKLTSSYKKKKKEKEKKRRLFTKGAFEDGYDIGDVTKTILGTVGDVATGVVKGFTSGVEGITDLGMYGVAGVLDAVGKDDSADRLRESTARSQTDQLWGGLEKTADKYSILGKKADSVIDPITNALGYIGMMYATAGIGAAAGVTGVGATALSTGTMFASSAGGSMGEAYQGGATDEEAFKHGVMKGAVDAGSELIFGGLGKATKALGLSRGLSSLDDIFAKKLSSKISNHFWKNAVQYGVKASAEGVEEVLAGLGSAVSKKLTYMSDEDLSKLIKDENLMEQFAVGTAASAIMQSGFVPGTTEGSFKESVTTGRDFITGQTQNEQAVIKKELENRIAEAEKDGTKLTSKQKADLEEKVVKDMERGYISTDTIEEVLGGETYEEYKRVSEWEDGLQNEYNELHAMKRGEMTGEQLDREAHLKEQLKNVKATSSRDALKTKLSDDVFGLIQGDRLIESYNERTRRGQVFEADLTKYDAKQQATIQKAIDSGILNNTNRTHEFVDIISKISADKGVLFDFTNNTKLKESGFAIDGKQVNGFVTKDGISINIDSPKAWQSTVGHEVTHVLEGTEVYTELQNTLFEYAKTKGEYDGRMKSLTELYKDVKDADINAELTADLVGEYLFTDENFIKNLSTQNRNVFQKIYDEIKYLYKVATGSKEAKELERVKRAFDQAYKEAGNGLSDTKYSLTEAFTDSNGTQYDNAVLLDTDFFDGTPPRKWGDKLRTMVNERAANNPFILPIIDENGNTTILQFASPKDRVTKDGKSNHKVLDKLSSSSDNISKLAVIHIDEIVSVSEENAPYHTNENNHQWLDQNGWLHRNANVINQKNGNIYNLTVDIAKAADGRTILYATDGKIKKVGNVQVNSLKIKGSGQNSNFDAKVAQEGEKVKYSLSDSTGKQLTKEQQEYFKDSKARDENGSLKLVYHSSPTAGFTVFDGGEGHGNYKFGEYSDGITFFTDNKAMADSYSPSSEKVDTKKLNTLEEAQEWLESLGFTDLDIKEKNGLYKIIDYDEGMVMDFESEEHLLRDLKRTIQEEYGDTHAGGQYEGYLNMKNPMIVDAEGRPWDRAFEGFSQELYDQMREDFTEEEKAALIDLAGWEDFGTFKDEVSRAVRDKGKPTADDYTRLLDSAFWKCSDLNALFDMAADGFSDESIRRNAIVSKTTNDIVEEALQDGSYDGVIIKNVIDYGGHAHSTLSSPPGNDYIVFNSNQFKAADNLKPTEDADIRYSLSKEGEQFGKTGQFATPATELRYEAPVAEKPSVSAPGTENSTTPTVAENATVQPETQLTGENSTVTADDMAAVFPNNAVPIQEELEQLLTERNELYGALEIAVDRGSANEVGKLAEEYEALNSRIKALESKETERTGSITDADAPAEMDAPLSMKSENYDPYNGVTLDDINRNYRTYSDRNPAARQYIEEAALGFAYDVANSTHGERWYNDELYYATGGEKGFGGTSRSTTDDIADLKDYYGYTWEQLRKAADDVVKGEVRSVAAKRVEYLVHKRLMEGYTDVDGRRYEPNQEYITFLNEQFANEQRAVGFDSLLEDSDHYAPYVEEAAPVKTLKETTADTLDAPIFDSKDKNAVKGQTAMFAPEKPNVNPRVASVLTKESKNAEKSGIGMKAVSAFVDKGMVFENLSLDSGNQEVQAKWNSALPANTEKKAQYFMENGAEGVKPLKDIIKDVKKTGKEEAFADYMYHVHNIDRMSLEDRFGLENKAVFGDTITAEVSTKKVQQYEKANPEFKAIAESVYAYNKHLRGLLVENSVISQETADLWEKEYPHYVPVRRVDQDGKNISVPLDTNKTGVNAPVKRATGGNSDIEPLFNTMAMHTEQVFSAIARNSFGIELKNTLGSTIDTQKNDSGVDEAINLIEDQESNLLKPGTLNSNPTFTVFENGERVEFEITEDMYDALKPAGKFLGYRNEKITKVSEWRRNLLTTWNPVFALWRNPVKDLQDVMINSQHAAKTYAQLITPTKDNVIYQIATHGKWAAEYESNGGKGSTYFDGKNKEFKVEDNIFKKTIGFPVRAIENAGEFIEEIPRLAEYIASRKEGRSVDRSMLDAARVTTNFAAGGDVTKLANAHGFTFLNASVQGASQHVRNFREATRQDGMKGFVKTLAKYTLAGIPGIILNNMIWDDDEEYEELSEYVKQNYYVVWKTKDGKFFRIPKGRTAAVMNNALEQMQHLVTGDDEADFGTFYELFMNNIAPNNPIENNILAPIMQVKNNRAWYGDDLVPSRLQKLPAEEQFDESTDALSKLIGEKTGTSPYKWNYLIDQYSGGLGDMILPMMTPEAESGDNTFVGNMLAPWKKEMTTDSTLNNKNPGNFYDLKDELDVVANGKNAKEEDKMRSMYLDSVGWDMGELYAQKREIQNSDLPDDQKYAKVREIQAQINELANTALEKYNHVRINGAYAEAGDRRYDYNAGKDKWYEITPKNADGSDNWYYIQEQLSHDKLGMSYDDFWNGKQPPEGGTYYAEYNDKRYNYDAEKNQWYEIRPKNDDGSDNWYYQKEQEVTKGLGISYEEYWSKPKEYNFAYDKPGKYAISQAVGGYDSYMEHYDVLENWQSDNYIGADKDSKGNSISGSRKKKVSEYIDGLDLDYGEKIILYRSVYSSKADKRAYNQDIIDYLNERDDIDYQEMKTILEELDFKVDSDGYITW